MMRPVRPLLPEGGHDGGEAGEAPSRAEILRAVLASHYNQPATALWRTVELEAVLRHVHFAGRMLDLGCGDGSLGALVIPATCTIFGVDLSLEDLKLAARTGRYTKVVASDAGALPFPDASFDMVFSNSVLEHIPHLDKVLRDISRVLRAGGELAFTVPSDQFMLLLRRPAQLRAIGRPEQAEAYVRELNARVQHYHYLSPAEWRDRLAAVGMQVVQAAYYLDRATLHAWERWHNRSAGVARRLTRAHLSTREIQRRFHLIGAHPVGLQRLLAGVFERLLLPAVKRDSGGGASGACLLVRAVKMRMDEG